MSKPARDNDTDTGQSETPSVPTQRERSLSRALPGRDASGFVLGLLAWSWVGLPFIKNGPTGVKNVLRAKFLNKGPKGEDLP